MPKIKGDRYVHKFLKLRNILISAYMPYCTRHIGWNQKMEEVYVRSQLKLGLFAMQQHIIELDKANLEGQILSLSSKGHS